MASVALEQITNITSMQEMFSLINNATHGYFGVIILLTMGIIAFAYLYQRILNPFHALAGTLTLLLIPSTLLAYVGLISSNTVIGLIIILAFIYFVLMFKRET